MQNIEKLEELSDSLSPSNHKEDISTINDNNNYDESVIEPQELTDDEKEKLRIEQIKSQHLRYGTKKHYGVAYKKERARKTRESKKGKKANRRK